MAGAVCAHRAVVRGAARRIAQQRVLPTDGPHQRADDRADVEAHAHADAALAGIVQVYGGAFGCRHGLQRELGDLERVRRLRLRHPTRTDEAVPNCIHLRDAKRRQTRRSPEYASDMHIASSALRLRKHRKRGNLSWRGAACADVAMRG